MLSVLFVLAVIVIWWTIWASHERLVLAIICDSRNRL